MVEELVEFNRAVEAVVAWVEQHSDWDRTLVIVTADQESGYLTGPGSGPPHTWNPPENHGAGNMPGLEWHSSGRTNSLVPFYAQGTAAAALAPWVEEFDQVRGYYLNNSEVAQVCRRLWEDSGGASGIEQAGGRTRARAGARLWTRPAVFRSAGALAYVLERGGPVELSIHDLQGRCLAMLERGPRAAGRHDAGWDPAGLPAGVYFARLRAEGRTDGCRLIVVR
jgi:hypothetical protein